MQGNQSVTTPFNNPLIRFVSEDKYRWLRHTLFILLGLILAFKGDVGVPDEQFPSKEAKKVVLFVDTVSLLFMLSMLYLLIRVLVPLLLFRSKVFLFAVCFFLLQTLMYFFVWSLDFYYLRPVNPGRMQHIDLSFMTFIQIGAVSSVLMGSVVGLVVFKKWISDVQRINTLQQTNLKVELEQLKSQVNPHFLFNTLNNLFVLTKTDPEKASQVILGLSDLLRYQLYDSAKDQILLTKDIEFIHNLLSLEKLRKNDFEFHIMTEGKMDGMALPPFLFIPFVENAIKHGASTIGHSYLSLSFRKIGKELEFISENSKPAVKKKEIGGLGLKNIQRRLDLLYPGNYSLKIKDEPDKYTVTLFISL